MAILGRLSNKIIVSDVDECTTDTHNCDANAVCTDTDGSFTCSCNSGYSGDGTTCTSKLKFGSLVLIIKYCLLSHKLST